MRQTLKLQGSLLVRNTSLNFGAKVLPLVVMGITVPYVIEGLGPARYGVFTLIWAVLGYFSALDLGLGKATAKKVAEALGRGESASIPAIAWTAVLLTLGLGLIASFTLIAFTPLLVDNVFQVDASLSTETQQVLYLSAVGLLIALVKSTFTGVLEAHQRFDLINLAGVPSSLLSAVIPPLVLYVNGGLPAIVILLVIKNGFELFVLSFLWLKVLPSGNRFFALDMKMSPALFSFGGWLTIHNVASYILQYVERFLIGTLLSVTAVTYYSVPYTLISALTVLPSSLMPVLFPAFSALHHSDVTRLENLFRRVLKYLVVLIGLGALFLMIFSEEILVLWIGKDGVRSVYVLQFLAAGYVLSVASWYFSTFLQGTGNIKAVTAIGLTLLAFQVPFSWALITEWGIEGAALAFTFSRALVVLGFYCTARRLNLMRPLQVSIGKLAKLIGGFLIIIAATVLLKTVVGILPWSIILSASVFIASTLFFSWHSVLTHEDKILLLQTVRRHDRPRHAQHPVE